jgi:hypothetical protein
VATREDFGVGKRRMAEKRVPQVKGMRETPLGKDVCCCFKDWNDSPKPTIKDLKKTNAAL